MNIVEEVIKILTEILDIDNHSITPETYLIRDLGAESIDLLELAVTLNSRFKIDVNDDEIFLRNIRQHIAEARQRNKAIFPYLSDKIPYLKQKRLKEILSELENGPILKVKDLTNYVEWKLDRD